ncbi:5'-3' exoribonuclease 2 [Endocarpon pusillum Z07020]|uniref:5'-3' exoribonuclease n=1 Tax=Endocarpon pusillum (strain Z07020 / HMAS-L-300199) TaxID=1263415 RepID=U1HZB0_ENDPU|nr:5'-3' exoribonuclease 2 [Endocarpon pusillum Z07020]ERF76240.1 5'-3' exoribonuclease 2 [Endocarpon pusillum Z07020]
MGVPALFRWLHKKYPKIITPVIEEQPYEVDGQQYPVDTTRSNPNGEEFDNLYLDFNGIVHPCSHPENKPPPATESEMMMEIFKYTERVVNMVRPRKLLLIAIDGVAPRAKMNQQRARRFRSARDAKEADEKKAEFQTLLRSQQHSRGDPETALEDVVKKTWDSNVITPGTPFMVILAISIRYWVQWKLNTDPAWEKLKVLISDATVPGEGEHKIMQFIRSQRADPEYDPNTKHVMYGLDADLIMLGIATHEPHFRILREDVEIRDAKAKTCNLCGQKGHYADNCRGNTKDKAGDYDEKEKTPDLKPFIWLNVPTLREYLGAEMFVPGQPFRFDLERALDDWVFMCFFVGNDFLPHLPSLDIHEDGIDTLIAIWRDNIPIMGGYLTCDGKVDLSRAQFILQGLAKQEDAIFRRRRQTEERREQNQKRRDQEKDAREQREQGRDAKRRRSSPDYGQGGFNGSIKGRSDDRAPTNAPMNLISPQSIEVDYNMVVNRGAVDRANAANKSAAAALKAQLMQKNKPAETPEKPTNEPGAVEQTPPSALGKRKAELLEEDDDSSTPGRSTPISQPETKTNGANPDDLPPDTVRLWETGYAERYYEQKFHVAPDDYEFRRKVAQSYVEGLAWVLLYYFQGCASWTWYYPYHYAPFAADFIDLDKMDIQFAKGKPFKPYEQLMGVLPAASNHAIPPVFHSLMTDPDSEIVDFYPEDFDLDANGKKQSWKAIVLLPFIDEKRLLSAMNTKYPLLTAEEHARNEMGKDALFVSDRHPLYDLLATEFYSKRQRNANGENTVKLPVRTGGLAGIAEKNSSYLPHMSLQGPEEDIKLEPEVDDDRSMSVLYTMPTSKHVHKSMLLRGVKEPAKVLDHSDIAILKSKARNSGRSYGGAPLGDRNGSYGNGGGRGGRGGGNISFQADRPPPPQYDQQRGGTGEVDRSNPFAAFLDPKFVPPPVVGANGRIPPPPPPVSQQYGRGPPSAGSSSYAHGGYGQRDDGGYGSGSGSQRGQYGGYGQGQYNGGRGGGGDRYGGSQQQYSGPPGGGAGGRSISDSYYASGSGQSYGQGGYGVNGDTGGGRGGGGGSQNYRGSYDPRYGDGYGRR